MSTTVLEATPAKTRTAAYAASSAQSGMAPFAFARREPLPQDIQLEVLFCGVCHSDLHTVRNEWKGTTFPVVPGHEIVGRVTAVGSEVKRFKPGDLAAVGCMVDSCRTCANCKAGLEQYCDAGFTGTATSTGFTILTGVEYMLVPHLSARLQYNYYDFGSQEVALPTFPTIATQARLHSVTVGLNYHF